MRTQEDVDFGRARDAAEGFRSSLRQSSGADSNSGIAVVELVKKEGCGLGLVVSGGIDKDDRPRVAYLRPGGIAQRSDALEVGDYIVSVNGIRTPLLRHDEIVNLLKNAGESVLLEVEYELPEPPQTTFSVLCKRVEVRLEKDGNTFGFTLRGGSHHETGKCRPLTVTQIRPGSSADREGTLKIGDRVLAINGVNVTRISLVEATKMLKHADHVISLLVEYDVSVMEAVQNASGPLLVEIDKMPGSSLGITLSTIAYKGKTVICIHSIRQASIADRCGALRVGDHILSIDETSLEHMTVAEANQLLKTSLGEQIRLEIFPAGQSNKSKATVENSTRTAGNLVTNGLTASHSHGSFSSSHSSHSQHSNYSAGAGLDSMCNHQGSTLGNCYNTMGTRNGNTLRGTSSWGRRDIKYSSTEDSGSLTSASSMQQPAMLPTQQVCHVETTEVLLVADHRGFGLTLQEVTYSQQQQQQPCDVLMEPPIITHIEPRAAAERCGVLQEGDRVLAINGQYLENKTLAQANEMLKDSGIKVTLHIEFDVAESIVPSSGIFNIKVCKRGVGLGITLSSPSNRQAGEPLIIADVKKGSVAHRTGTIQPGDKLLAIDNVRLDNCTIEDAAEILQNTEEIVKLKIKKDELFSDEPDPSSYISYTVELQKMGGPLGITISGSEEPFDPIYIAGLSERGLAEKTGALHVGDRILAINNKSLRGKPLSDAISLLQDSSDTVTLKISRPSNSRRNGRKSDSDRDSYGEKYGTPIQSVDSALESWDSSGLDSKKSSSQSTTKSQNNNSEEPGSPEPSHRVECMPRSGTYDDLKNELIVTNEVEWDRHSGGHSHRSHSVPSSAEQDIWSQSVDDLDRLAHPDMIHHSDSGSLNTQQYIDRSKRKLPTSCTAAEINADNIDELSDIGSFTTSTRMGAELHLQEVEEQLQNIFTPTPVELHRVTLYKWKDNDDFGFSLSDGVYEKGVYISAIRPSGPADKSGTLRSFDRLLQVNEQRVRDLECHQVVPLIAASGKTIDLVISRNPLALGEGGLDDAMSDIWKPRRDSYRPPQLHTSTLRVQTV